ncbi:hypothetical protein AB8Q18_08085 [Neisseriaceae bacterium CLB008]|nr:hypothetical protein [Neisseriaceae bacterium]
MILQDALQLAATLMAGQMSEKQNKQALIAEMLDLADLILVENAKRNPTRSGLILKEIARIKAEQDQLSANISKVADAK